jgi:hypothetical protein
LGYAANLLVDLELYNASGHRIAHNIFPAQSFAAGIANSYVREYPVPFTLAAGIYTFKIGVFSNDWQTLYHWTNDAGSFVVINSPPPCVGGISVGPGSVTLSVVVAGATVKLQATVCSGSAAFVLVDLEI